MKKLQIRFITSFLTLCFSLYTCNGQEIPNDISIGIGFLATNTSFPIPFYKNENDSTPFDILKFNVREDGTTEFETKLKLKPYMISEGDSFEEGERNVNHGLVHFAPELKFRVIDSTKTYFKVITNEKYNEEYYIKIEPPEGLLHNIKRVV